LPLHGLGNSVTEDTRLSGEGEMAEATTGLDDTERPSNGEIMEGREPRHGDGPGGDQHSAWEDQTAELRWLKARLGRSERAIAVLRDLLKEEATARETAVRERHELLGPLYDTIGDRDREIGELWTMINHLHAETGSLRAMIDRQQAETERLHAETGSLRAMIDRQQAETERLQAAYRAEIHSIHQSKFWPLVRLSGAVRRWLDRSGGSK
jgi:hypothetical protein